jgi:hypothetical protein
MEEQMDKKDNIAAELEIDQMNLDGEWVYQPALMGKYAAWYAQANDRVAHTKDKLAIIEATAYNDIIADSEKKPTEKQIQSEIIQRDDYQSALDALRSAQKDEAVFKAAVQSLEHKKKALENLVTLWVGSYFAGPKSPKEVDMGEVHSRATRGRQRKGLKNGRDDNE